MDLDEFFSHVTLTQLLPVCFSTKVFVFGFDVVVAVVVVVVGAVVVVVVRVVLELFELSL